VTLLATPALQTRQWLLAVPTEVGGKGAGLLRLAPDWYPPTLILPLADYEDAKNGVPLGDILMDEDLAAVALALNTTRLLLRSSASSEGIVDRGRYLSVATSVKPSAIRDAVQQVWDSLDGPGAMAVLIQRDLDPRLSGHMSNEHRVARDKLTWFCEYNDGRPSQMLRVHGVRQAGEGPLLARTERSLLGALRGVARRLGSGETRVHVEWVWDGERLWVVQADDVLPTIGPAPGEAFVPRRGRTIQTGSLNLFRDADFKGGELDWPKVAGVADFRAAGLGSVPLYLMSDTNTIALLASGDEPADLLADIELLTEGDVVIRCDVASADAGLLLPRTQTETDSKRLLAYMQETARGLLAAGVAPGAICFIAHRYLRARACAWSYARPGQSTVRVDATWGIIDGLSWVPHDSFWVGPDDVRRRIRPKTSFLDVSSSGRWNFRVTPTEWIWASSARDEQLQVIAEGARNLAEKAAKPIVTMWFLDLLDDYGVAALPWFQMTYEIDLDAPASAVKGAVRRVIVDTADLASLQKSLDADGLRPYVLVLRPTDEAVREPELVGQVAAVAREHGFTVEIDGSPLGHPYYELRRADVNVVCRYNEPPDAVGLARVRHGKLVRDGVPQAIADGGERVVAYRASDEERGHWLRAKAIEEAVELYWAPTPEAQVGELADLQEVVQAFAAWLNVSEAELDATALQKRMRRGGLRDGLVLLDTLSAEDLVDEAEQLPLPGLPEGVGWSTRPRRRYPLAHATGGVRIPYSPSSAEFDVFTIRLASVEVLVRYAPDGITLTLGDQVSAQLTIPGLG
jgi:predicted house-cleaning noncanonical NTP pyrophosphatase (MazG superfamily)